MPKRCCVSREMWFHVDGGVLVCACAVCVSYLRAADGGALKRFVRLLGDVCGSSRLPLVVDGRLIRRRLRYSA